MQLLFRLPLVLLETFLRQGVRGLASLFKVVRGGDADQGFAAPPRPTSPDFGGGAATTDLADFAAGRGTATEEDLTADDEVGDELLLDSDDILTSPVGSAPIAPPADDELAGDSDIESAKPAASPRESGTLFERMSNIARGAAKAQGEDEEPGEYRPEPIDIPRFLNRQNNQ
jgi:hypothetical protein